MRLNPVTFIFLLCGISTIVTCVYAWQHRSTLGARAFTVFMAALAVYIFGYSMELSSLDLEHMLFWSKLQYLGILFYPPFYLIFTLEYTGKEKWLTRRNVTLLLMVPAILWFCKLFDQYLHLIYATAEVDFSGVIPLLSFTRGPLYFVAVIYGSSLVTLGCFGLWNKLRSGSALYRQQTTLMLVAAVIVYGVFGLYLAQKITISGFPHLDVNIFGYTVWGIAVGVAIFRHRLFDLAPIARDTLIEMLQDGVLVLDVQYRVVDANPEARRILIWSRVPVGQFMMDLMPAWMADSLLGASAGELRLETSLANRDDHTYYEITPSVLKDKRDESIGYLLVIHDISERIEIEKKLEELSLIDDLTGLSNRRGFKVLADQLILMASRMKLDVTLLYMDLDRLKWVNDHLGHATGDQALVETAQVLKASFRSSDVVARLGGDEFVVLAFESEENTGEAMLARLQDKVREWNEQEERQYTLSLSAGLAFYSWRSPVDLEMLLATADEEMYKMKQANRINHLVTFD